MKLKNIFLITAVAGWLFSCVSEELIAPPATGKGADATFDLTLKMGDIIATKAIGEAATPYKYATPDELDVSKCVVAIFRLSDTGVPGERVGYKSVAGIGADLARATVNDTLAYKISGVPVKTGKVRVLVVANSAVTDYAALDTYAKFQTAIETTQFTSSFDPKNLVKMGYIDTELTLDNYNNEIVVPMVQLAARIDLNIIVDLPKIIEKTEVIYPNKVEEEVFNQIGKNGGNGTYTVGGITYTSKECKNDGHEPLLTGKTFFNPILNRPETIGKVSGSKFAEVEGLTIDSVTTINSWGLKINAITINNIQTQTPVIIESVNTLALKKLINDPWRKEFNPAELVIDTFKTTFYTYQKDIYANDKDPEALNVNIDANLIKGTYEIHTQYKVMTIGIWVEKKHGTTSGWSDDGKFVPIINIGDALGKPVAGEFSQDNGSQEFHKLYTIWINPHFSKTAPSTDGVIHGNLYSIDAIFKNTVQEIELKYNVTGWTSKEVTIPPFE